MTIISEYAWAALLVTAAVFNVACFWLIRRLALGVNLKQAMREKAPSEQPEPVTTTIQTVDGTTRTETEMPDNTSYSRVAGMIGAIVMACLFWAVGNIAIYLGFTDVDGLAKLVGNIGGLFLGGSALFAPYAFNKLTEVFPKPKA